MAMIEQVEMNEAAGFLPPTESHDTIQQLGVNYQLVTDYTSMIVLDDATHAKRGIARNNQQRTATERAAQSVRAAQPARQARVDTAQPAFPSSAPHVSRYGNGGGNTGGHSGGGDLSKDQIFVLFMGVIVIAGICLGRHASSGSKQ
jgi:Ca-activated chloride channel family protein